MKKANINYPHPVLSAANEDYLNSYFNIELLDNPVIEGNNAIIRIKSVLSCPGLSNMIDNGRAKIVVYCESVETEYRKIEPFSNAESVELLIDKNALSKSVQVRGYIIATENMSSFSLPEHNADLFGSIPFKIRKGDILGISEDFYNIPIDSYDPLADRPSIFSVRRNPDGVDDIIVNYMEFDKITIFLNNDVFDKYQKLYEAPEMRSILASMIVMPALVDVLSFLKSADEDTINTYQTKKWFQVLKSRIDELSIDLNQEASLTKIANSILPHIVNGVIDGLGTVFESLLPTGGELDEG